jgi:hypothetical protein
MLASGHRVELRFCICRSTKANFSEMTWASLTDTDFFAANPSRNYRMRMATPSEIAAIRPAPDPRHFIYVVKCRHLPFTTPVFDGDVTPLPGELDDEETAKEVWRGALEIGEPDMER